MQKITGNRKYYFNNLYFDSIDSEEKAYGSVFSMLMDILYLAQMVLGAI